MSIKIHFLQSNNSEANMKPYAPNTENIKLAVAQNLLVFSNQPTVELIFRKCIAFEHRGPNAEL